MFCDNAHFFFRFLGLPLGRPCSLRRALSTHPIRYVQPCQHISKSEPVLSNHSWGKRDENRALRRGRKGHSGSLEKNGPTRTRRPQGFARRRIVLTPNKGEHEVRPYSGAHFKS